MKKRELEFYINNKKVEIDKKKVYRRNVKVSFNGKAILINNKLQDNDINKRTEITNSHVIKQNGDYTIVYTINENSYYIDFYIKKIYMFVFLLLIILLSGFVLFKPINKEIKTKLYTPFSSFWRSFLFKKLISVIINATAAKVYAII